MKKLLLVFSTLFTGCMTKPLATTCDRFGMYTARVDVIALNHDVKTKGYVQTKFVCLPKRN